MEKAEELGESEVFWGSGGLSWLMNIQHTDVGLLLAGVWHKKKHTFFGVVHYGVLLEEVLA